MPRLILGAVISVSGIVGVAGQQAPPVFRGGTTLIAVDATVLDHDGRPVVDLATNDFEVKVNGQRRTVRTVTYEHVAPDAPGAVREGSTAKSSRDVSNASPAAEPPLVVMFVDDLSITPSRGKGMFFAAADFVRSLPSGDVIGFATSSRTSMLNPTMDRAAIEAGLRHAAGEFIDPRDGPPSVDVQIADALEIMDGDQSRREQVVRHLCFGDRPVSEQQMETSDCTRQVDQKIRFLSSVVTNTTNRQIQALVETINAMAEAPGLKELVVVSDGLAVAQRRQLERFEPVARAAATGGVHMNVLSQDPDLTDVSRTGPSHYADDRERVFGLMSLTDLSGGNFYRVMGQPERFFGFVSQAISGIYHLGVEIPSSSSVKGDLAVTVRAKRSGLTVHANRVALLPKPALSVPAWQRLDDAVTKGLPNYGVPLTLGWVLRRGRLSSAVEIDANVEIPTIAEMPLTVMYGLLDETGHVETGRRTIASPATSDGYRISLSLPVAAGRYRLRFAVADARGRVGSVDAPVAAMLSNLGGFAASDIVLSWSNVTTKPQFLALSEVPPSATSLQSALELYPSADQPMPTDVDVHWTIVEASGRRLDEQAVTPTASTDRLAAAVQWSLDAVPPGEYDIEATVEVGGRRLGTVRTTFRKGIKNRLHPDAP